MAQAAGELGSKNFAQAALLSKKAEDDPHVKPWALLVEAQSAENLGQFAAAEKLYRAIPENRANSLDGRIGLLRLELARGQKLSLDGKQLSALDLELKRAGRTDLQSELLFLRGQIAAAHGDIELASSLLTSVRKRQPGKDVAIKARELLWQIQAKLEAQSPEQSIAALVAEATQLLKENEPELARQKIAAAKKHLRPNTTPYFEAELEEEQALRALGKTDAADHVLAEVAADGDRGTADQALIKIIKGAWNKNEHDRTLKFIAQYRSRFGRSADTDEMKFIEASTLDSMERRDEARSIYREIMKSGRDLSYRNRAIRQLAWGAYRDKNYVLSAHIFAEGADETKSSLDETVRNVKGGYSAPAAQADVDTARSRLRAARDLLDDYLHHRYWLADSLSRLAEPTRKKEFAQTAAPADILRAVYELAPYSYYGQLAARRLGLKNRSVTKASGPSCVLDVDKETGTTLALLGRANLREFSKAEIEWWLAHQRGPDAAALELAIAGGKVVTLDELTTILTRIQLLLEYSYPDRAVMLADSLFKRPALLQPFDPRAAECLPALGRLAFPQPFAEFFNSASQATGVPAALLYAHARTESYFDPRARSPKDARGLMQLLPSTAAREGVREGANLFDPELNISTGAKHLAGLLKNYQGNVALAASAYNAGAAATDRWIGEYDPADMNAWVEMITFPETRDYVKKVLLTKSIYENS